jgi:hypothetical protein
MASHSPEGISLQFRADQHQHSAQPYVYCEQPNSKYVGHQSLHLQSQIQVLPSGHTIYINAPSTQQYQGYATIQYHPKTQQHHIVHQTGSSGMSSQPHEQYISVVPVQGPAHIQSVGPGGTYTYWQPPDGQPCGPHTVTILPQGAAGLPVAVSHRNLPSGGATTPKQRNQNQQRHHSSGGRGKEKGGKSRKSGGSTPGRKAGGTELKLQTTNGHCNVSLLDEYKNKKNNREWTVVYIKGNVVEFCKDQNGSRFVQQRLEVGDAEEKDIVMAEILPVIDVLRNDVFGNYVVQKLLECGTVKMKEDLRDTLTGEIVSLSVQIYG